MRYIENKKYCVFQYDSLAIYFIKSHGSFRVYKMENGMTSQLLNDVFVDVKLLSKGDCYCYLLLRKFNGSCTVIDILNMETVNSFHRSELLFLYKRTIDKEYEKETDAVFALWKQDKKNFSIWSLKEGYLFEPYDCNKLEEYANGVILDDKLAVEYNGSSYDISSYKEIKGCVYYSEEKDRYLYLLDQDESLFVTMDADEYDKNIVKADLISRKIEYNKKTEELSIIESEDPTDWSEYNDIAYEGYSRLELGYDD